MSTLAARCRFDGEDKMSKRYVGIADVCARYQKHHETITRWMRDPRIGFPQPAIRAGGLKQSQRLWDESHLDAFDERHGKAAAA
jgi:hypothetical protein